LMETVRELREENDRLCLRVQKLESTKKNETQMDNTDKRFYDALCKQGLDDESEDSVYWRAYKEAVRELREENDRLRLEVVRLDKA